MDHLTRILCQDELGVKLEDDVLLVLQKWIKNDEESRRNDVEKFSKCIRLPLVDFDKSIGILSEFGLVSHYHAVVVVELILMSTSLRICEGVLLVAGGMEKRGNPATIAFEATTYDVNSDSWTSFPSLATPVYRQKILTASDELYALGGIFCDVSGKSCIVYCCRGCE